ncbi:MAG: Rid family hydrolase [Acidobacteriota bacterium]|nr:Rid family hydrolase [Acidobacteriota bacterium]
MLAGGLSVAAVLVAVSCPGHSQTTVKRIYGPAAQRFANAVWAGDTLYVAGQMASPQTPADKAKGTAAVYGDTEAQTESALRNIETILKAQGLTLADVVQMEVYLSPDPAKGNTMDFAGMNAAYSKVFGTAEQPNKPVRAAMQVAALATPWGLVEIQVVAVKSK